MLDAEDTSERQEQNSDTCEAYEQCPNTARDIDALVVELARMHEHLALLQLDRLSEASEVGPSAFVFVQAREHCLPGDVALMQKQRSMRCVQAANEVHAREADSHPS